MKIYDYEGRKNLCGGAYTFSAFIAGTVTEAIPGILLQILLIPLIVDRVTRAK